MARKKTPSAQTQPVEDTTAEVTPVPEETAKAVEQAPAEETAPVVADAAPEETAPPVEDEAAEDAPVADGVVETKVGELSISSNNKFVIQDNTDAERVPPPSTGKATVRKNGSKGFAGFKVVDYQ